MDEHRIDEVARAYRSQLGESPPAVADAAVSAFRHTAMARAWSAARVLLVIAGLAGLSLDVPVLIGAASHTSADVAVLHTAMAVGFLVAAWRPARYARGLAPVAVAAAVLLVLPASTDPATTTSGLAELSHLPVFAGAAALLLGGWLVPHRRTVAST